VSGGLALSSGNLPPARMFMKRFRRSNQKGAPRETAKGGEGQAGELVQPVPGLGGAGLPAHGEAELLELSDSFVGCLLTQEQSPRLRASDESALASSATASRTPNPIRLAPPRLRQSPGSRLRIRAPAPNLATTSALQNLPPCRKSGSRTRTSTPPGNPFPLRAEQHFPIRCAADAVPR
jgi:hypothetical protein